MTDLKTLSLRDLKKLQGKIAQELGRRHTASKGVLLKKLEKLARSDGFTLSEVLGELQPASTSPGRAGKALAGSGKAVVKPAKKVAVKYRHPDDKSLTWTGRGSKPLWVQAYLANGGALEELDVGKKVTPPPEDAVPAAAEVAVEAAPDTQAAEVAAPAELPSKRKPKNTFSNAAKAAASARIPGGSKKAAA